MKLHRRLLTQSTPLALAIGNFDGVHRGHQAILDATRSAASRLGLEPAAMTFAPLPREYFARLRGDAALAPARLMSVTEKLAAFADVEGFAQAGRATKIDADAPASRAAFRIRRITSAKRSACFGQAALIACVSAVCKIKMDCTLMPLELIRTIPKTISGRTKGHMRQNG